MKAIITDIKRFAVHDGDGIRTTAFFKGCPLRCVWCHNPEGLNCKPELALYNDKCIGCGECVEHCPNSCREFKGSDRIYKDKDCTLCGKCVENCPASALTLYGKEYTVDELLPLLLEDEEFYKNSGGGVTLSGGECLMQADFCRELLKRLKENGIHTAVDTSGFVSREKLDEVIPYTDIFLYDIKAFDEDVHIKCTEKSNKIILDNLLYLDLLKKPIEIRIPYVPVYNAGEMEKIAEFLTPLKSVKAIRVLPYHAYARGKYKALGISDTLPKELPSKEEIAFAKEILSKTGFTVI